MGATYNNTDQSKLLNNLIYEVLQMICVSDVKVLGVMIRRCLFLLYVNCVKNYYVKLLCKKIIIINYMKFTRKVNVKCRPLLVGASVVFVLCCTNTEVKVDARCMGRGQFQYRFRRYYKSAGPCVF